MSRLDLADGLRLLHEASGGEYLGHEAHLRFAWSVLDEAEDREDAARLACLTIRHAAELGGNPAKYHATVTIFWIRLLEHLRRTYPDVSSVGAMIERYPALGNSSLPERHWSNLHDDEARAHWVEPDLIPIP
ncbi:MAG TPA: hypothetical protein VIH55_03245 [Acidimicrobiia bacterium]